MKAIDRQQVLAQWESIYADAVLKMQQDGLFLEQVKSHTGGRDKIIRAHPAFAIFKEAAEALGKFNEWHKTAGQLALDLEY